MSKTNDIIQYVSALIKFIIQNVYGNINGYVCIIIISEDLKYYAELFLISTSHLKYQYYLLKLRY